MGTAFAAARDMAKVHGSAFLGMIVATALGILATGLFQIAASRGLGPDDFGLLSAFLGFINIAAIGSAALRSSVAVGVATSATAAEDGEPSGRDRSQIEAWTMGGLFTVGLLVASPWIASALGSSWLGPLVAAATVIPYFLVARAPGVLQGRERTTAVVWLSSIAQIAQLILAVVAMAIGWAVAGVLVAYFVVIVAVAAISSRMARGSTLVSTGRAFSSNTMIVLGLSIAFAWLTSIDVILVRGGTSAADAGAYAAAAVLVKMTLVLPSTLSLYLLPRLVRARDDSATTRLGVLLSLAVTALGGLVIALVLALVGGPITSALFGAKYSRTADLVPWMALAWIGWALTQAMLARVSAMVSKGALLVMAVAIVAQLVAALVTLPNLYEWIVATGVIGAATFIGLFSLHLRDGRSER